MRARFVQRAPDPSVVHVEGPWTHRHVLANGIRLHCVESKSGAGAAPDLVLLLHGFAEHWWSWRHQLTELRGYHVVAPDLRGYGDSDKPPRGYDGWTLSGDVAGLIRALGYRKAHLVGHGWGGLLAWTVAALHPRLLDSVTVINAPHPLALRAACRDSAQLRALGFTWFAQLPRFPERLMRGDGVERLLRGWSGSDWPLTDEVLERHRVAMRIPGAAHCSAEYFRWAVRSQLRRDGRDYAAAIGRTAELPVLRIHGTADPQFLLPAVRASASWAPNSRLELLPGIGHFAQQESPAEVTALLQHFLRTYGA